MKTLSKKQFKIIIEKDEEGYFVASVPALPGCHAQAKTLSDLTVKIQDAIKLCLSVAKTNKAYSKRIQELSYEPSFIGIDTVTV
ncbi:MAG: type II toxin-antitoxin system HicB family antitoxin [Parcubacteria group bacterium]|nr:type II toxin-antitoxin system HicB family antitoxin [Parcubacteria group bacterium]